MEIYLETVMVLNFLVDFLLLLGTDRLAGFPAEPLRCAAAAAVGALYSGGCLLPGFRFLGALPWRLVSLCLMGMIAFDWDLGGVKRGGIFLLMCLATGGVAVSLGRRTCSGLILGALVVWLLSCLGFAGSSGREYVPVTLAYGEKSASFLALKDTGNQLRDPVTGEQVLVVSGKIGERLTGLTPGQLKSPLETLARRPIPGLRLIPYCAVGENHGMLLALRFPKAKIGENIRSTLVAFAPEGLDGTQVYQALTGGVL